MPRRGTGFVSEPVSSQWLVCRAGGALCALPLEPVDEIMRLLPIEAVAAPDCVLGLSIIRGAPVPVVDLALLLGEATGAAPSRLVTLALDGRAVALTVDAVLGVRAIDAGRLDALPPLLQDRTGAAIAAIGTLDEELLFLLQTARLVPDEVFEPIAAGASG
jgi:purine-binding chemotaxis protein CheW